MKTYLFAIGIFICYTGSAQNKRDSVSAWTINVGNKFAYDLIFFKNPYYNDEHYKYRPSFTNSIIGEVKYAFGKRKIVGLAIEPYFGYKYVSFNAIIPSTDFDNPPDAFTNLNHEFQFYKNGQLLPTEHYTYKKSYLKYGINLNLSFKLNSKLYLLINVGMNKLSFNTKNYPNYSLPKSYMGSPGCGFCYYTNNVDLFYQADPETIKNIGLGLQYKLNKRFVIGFVYEMNADSFLEPIYFFNTHTYLPFFSDYEIEDYFNPSLGFTLKYILNHEK